MFGSYTSTLFYAEPCFEESTVLQFLTFLDILFSSPFFLTPLINVGIILFISGATINLISDHMLLKLKGTDNCYKIPSGFLYNYIACPNYFGEIIEWIGFAIMTWSFPGLIFAFFNKSSYSLRGK